MSTPSTRAERRRSELESDERSRMTSFTVRSRHEIWLMAMSTPDWEKATSGRAISMLDSSSLKEENLPFSSLAFVVVVLVVVAVAPMAARAASTGCSCRRSLWRSPRCWRLSDDVDDGTAEEQRTSAAAKNADDVAAAWKMLFLNDMMDDGGRWMR